MVQYSMSRRCTKPEGEKCLRDVTLFLTQNTQYCKNSGNQLEFSGPDGRHVTLSHETMAGTTMHTVEIYGCRETLKGELYRLYRRLGFNLDGFGKPSSIDMLGIEPNVIGDRAGFFGRI